MRIGIISDIHANDVALETVLQAMGPVDRLWCLGDMVGYGPNPNESVARLLQQPSLEICLTGNHDWAALGKIDLNDFNPEARQAALWTREQLTKDSKQFLQDRPEQVVRDAEFTLAHGSPRQPVWEYITSTAVARANFDHFTTPICVVGHTHVPAIYFTDSQGIVRSQTPPEDAPLNLRDGSRFIINPGSVGQPRDNDPRAAYALLDSDSGMLTFHRVAYDIALTQQRMFEAGLPARLILRLNYGW
jgi:diadenosine tetraphosphatase ApaH/serine/threonine PP2A family protein phosphatase